MIDLAWVFHWLCARVFVLCLAIKREGTLSFSEIFVPDILGEYALQFPENEFSTKICQRSNFLICKSTGAKLELNIRAMKGRSYFIYKNEKKKNLFTLKEVCEKIQESMNCRKNFRKFQKLK